MSDEYETKNIPETPCLFQKWRSSILFGILIYKENLEIYWTDNISYNIFLEKHLHEQTVLIKPLPLHQGILT